MILKPARDLRSTLAEGLGKSLASLLIKTATAGLTYLTYVVLARAMDATEYGLFAFGLSLATLLSIAASMGQQTAILRYWPEETGAGQPDRARAALRAGGAITILAGSAITLGLVFWALTLRLIDGSAATGHLLAAAALIVPMALAEYFSAALRAQGSVWIALAPRDLVWRITLPVLVAALYGVGLSLSGWQALLLTAATLGLALMLQAIATRHRRLLLKPGREGLGDYVQRRGGASRWFFLGTLIDSAALNVDIILVGLMIAPEEAGHYFNAFRTAGLLTLFTFALTLVIAPMVARHYHAGDMRKAQAVAALCAWGGFVFSLVVFAGFVLFGDRLLSLFGPVPANGHLVLILLGVGLLFDAATGPSRIVMMMTGHERAYVRIFGGLMGLGMLAQLALIPLFGIVGAAAANMGARIVAQTAIALWSRRHIGLDTSLLGAFRMGRLANRTGPVASL
ncbi:lipopolysaccharide biosynthesis protein [Arsenicitalea aurantiaca]|uniref:Lipopolysaccharide biosynthesis protein n=1 Tax=Arsenicitalea aurantiaca TaxID=1783274 RepID=A0A433X5L4_9HYPH|nr:lipopolysaccharide biosynthesis protein [Arsenicitalea aurantiaca]RUT29338.1 lipopolysaccharide biosynthesis protein [Arsenicitalea aurantiaca]